MEVATKRSRYDPVEAFTLFELLVILAVVILVLTVGIGVQNSRDRASAQRIKCTTNLKYIGLAFKTWPPGQIDEYPMALSVTNGGTMELTNSSLVFRTFLVMSNELATPEILICRADNRVPATGFDATFSNSNISYFIGLDGSEEAPQMFLAGDRNITNGLPVHNGLLLLPTNSPIGWDHQLHRGQGNVLLCDGSVQQVTSSRLWNLLCATGTNTTRIMLP